MFELYRNGISLTRGDRAITDKDKNIYTPTSGSYKDL